MIEGNDADTDKKTKRNHEYKSRLRSGGATYDGKETGCGRKKNPTRAGFEENKTLGLVWGLRSERRLSREKRPLMGPSWPSMNISNRIY